MNGHAFRTSGERGPAGLSAVVRLRFRSAVPRPDECCRLGMGWRAPGPSPRRQILEAVGLEQRLLELASLEVAHL
jgi:hypothetical protein